MLVLSRKPGERILVPHCGVVITVVSVRGNRVRLGISAPDGVTVYREEIWPGPASTSEAAGPDHSVEVMGRVRHASS
jgi:carbon storage regulator